MDRRATRFYVIILTILVAAWIGGFPSPVQAAPPGSAAALPVFPGAQGFGTDTPGGRGGRIYVVTTLADSGPGSLRQALTAQGPRIVLFEVSGVIWLDSDLSIYHPYLTVAGQTAPSPGITIAGGCVRIKTHDVVIRHIHFRAAVDNGVSISGYPDHTGQVYKVVLDHCSFSWAANKNLMTWYDEVTDLTVSHSIVSESLLNPATGNRMGFLIGDHAHRVSVIGNLFAHNSQRNPAPYGDTSSVIVNNVVYNPGPGTIHFQDDNGSGPLFTAAVGNVIIPGQDTPNWLCRPDVCRPIRVVNTTAPGTRIYLADNDAPGRTTDPWGLVELQVSFNVKAEQPPIWVEGLTVRPSHATVEWVLTHAGARPWDRDAVDARIVSEVRNGTGRQIATLADVGGMPAVPVVRRALTIPPNPHGDDDLDGYTNVEEWLFSFEHSPSAPAPFRIFLPIGSRE